MEIDFDLEKTPLQIFTKTPFGSEGYVAMAFNSGPPGPGSLLFNFKSTPQFSLYNCVTGNLTLSPSNKRGTNKIWEISMMTGPRILIHCNKKKVLDIKISEETCSGGGNGWRTFWSTVDVETIRFLDRKLEVSKYYRAAKMRSA